MHVYRYADIHIYRVKPLGCVSPASAATEHSVSTLRTVMELACGELYKKI